jgi:hypothetical protein
MCRIGACIHFNHCLIFLLFFEEVLSNCNSSMDSFNFGNVRPALLNVYKNKWYKRLAIVPLKKILNPQWSVTIELVHKIISFFIYLLESVPGGTNSMTKAQPQYIAVTKTTLVLTIPLPFHAICLRFSR